MDNAVNLYSGFGRGSNPGAGGPLLTINEDVNQLTTFGNPFAEDEDDQGSYAIVSSLFSKVKNTFTLPSTQPTLVPNPTPAASNNSTPGSITESKDSANKGTLRKAPAPPNAAKGLVAARVERPGFGLRQARAAPPLMSLTPVISESVPFPPSEHSDGGSNRGGGSPAPFHHASTHDGEFGVYGNFIPGFPIQDDTRSIRTVASGRRNGSASKVIRRIRGEGLSRDYWMEDETCKECYDCKTIFTTWRRKHHCRICGQIFCSRCASNIIKGSRFGQNGMVRVCNLCLRMLEEEDDDDDGRSIASVSTNFPPHQLDLSHNHHSPYSASQLFSRGDEPFNLYSIGEARRKQGYVDGGSGSGSRPSTPAEGASEGWESKRDVVPPPFRRGIEEDDEKDTVPSDALESFMEPSPFNPTAGRADGDGVPFPVQPVNKAGVVAQSFIRFPGLPSSPDGLSTIPVPLRSRFNSYATEYDPSTPHVRKRVHSKMDSLEMPSEEAGWRTRRESSAYAAELNAVSMFHLRIMLRQMISKERIPHAKEWEDTLLKLALKVASYLNLNPRTPGSYMDARWYVKVKKIPGGSPRDSEYVDGAVITKNVAHKLMSRHLRQPRIMLVTFPFDYNRVEGQFMSIDPILAQEREYLKNLALRVAAHQPHVLLVEGTVSRLALEYLLEKKIAVARSVKPSAIQFVSRITQSDVISSMDRLALEPRMGECARFRIQTFEHSMIPGRRKTYMRFEGCSREMGCTLILRGGDLDTLRRIKKVTKFIVFIVRNLKMETYLWKDTVVTMPPVTTEAAPVPRPRVLSSASVFTISGLATGSRTPTYPSNPRWSTADTIDERSSDKASDDDLPEEDRQRRLLSRRIQKSIDPYFTTFISASATLRFPPPHPIKKMKELDDQLEHARHEWEDAEVAKERAQFVHLQERTITSLHTDDGFGDDDALYPGRKPLSVEGLPPNISVHGLMKSGGFKFDLDSYDDSRTPTVSSDLAKSISTLQADQPAPSYFDVNHSTTESYVNSAGSSIVQDPSKSHPTLPLNLLEAEEIALSSDLDSKRFQHLEQLRIWEWYLRKNADDFVVEKYQNINLLHMTIPTLELGLQPWCTPPRMEHMIYYRDKDCSLVQYIEDACRKGLDHTRMCNNKGCKLPQIHHSQVFIHNDSRLLIATEPWRGEIIGSTDAIPPNPDFITTWSVCRICNKNTPFIPLTEEAGKYSLAKFLELHFYPADVRLLRGAGCDHNIYLHHMRYFAVNKMTLRFQTDPIKLYEIAFPPMRTRVRPESLLELKNQDYKHMLIRNDDYWKSVSTRVAQWQALISPTGEAAFRERGIYPLSAAIAELAQRCERDRMEITTLIHKTYAESSPTDTLAAGPIRTAIQNQVVQWDTEFDRMEKTYLTKSYLAAERDFRKITGTNFKKVYDFINGGQSSVSEAESKTSHRPHVSEVVNPSSSASEKDSDNGDNESNAENESNAGSIEALPFPRVPLSLASEVSEAESEQSAVLPLAPFYLPDIPLTVGASSRSDPESDHTVGANRSHEAIDSIDTSMETQPSGEQTTSPEPKDREVDRSRPHPLSRLPRRPRPHPSVADLVRQFQGISPPMEDVSSAPRSIVVSESEPEAKPEPRRRGRTKSALMKGDLQASNAITSDFERSYAANVGPRHLVHTRRHPANHRGGSSRIPAPVHSYSAYESHNESVIGATSRQTSPVRSLAIHKDRRPALGRTHTDHALRHRAPSPQPRKGTLALKANQDASPPDRGVSSSRVGGKGKHVARQGVSAREKSAVRSQAATISIKGSTRRVPAPPPGSRVSNITKQFERLSRENDRANKRYAIMRGRRARPVASGKAKVEIFENIMDAARDNSEEESSDSSSEADDEYDGEDTGIREPRSAVASQEDLTPQPAPETNRERLTLPLLENLEKRETANMVSLDSPIREVMVRAPLPPLNPASPSLSRPPSPLTRPVLSIRERASTGSLHSDQEPSTSQGDRVSMIHTLVGYSGLSWIRESSPSFVQLKYPASPSEHLFEEAPITIREDEPTSIIAFTLQSAAYRSAIHKTSVKMSEKPEAFMPDDASIAESRSTWGVISLDGASDTIHELKNPPMITHPVLHFESAGVQISCTVFHAEQFDSLRRACNCEASFIESLARCVKWDATGGKSGSVFLKTRDDRFIAKGLQGSELDAMSKFAPKYFEHMSNSLSAGRPTLLAKIFGFYKVVYRNTVLGKTVRMTLMVMENLFYERRFCQIYDLKGSSRNRHVNPSKNPNQVLLDENLAQNSHKSPFYIREHAKRILRGALWNDTEFLSELDVMDYSLLVAVDDNTNEIVVGIVDFIRTYTWDKRLETLLKESTFGKGEPTIVTPKQYKTRFRGAMERYFLLVPDRWMKQKDTPDDEGQSDW